MVHRRPPRIPDFCYLGEYRYFVTCCTRKRRRVFTGRALVELLSTQILQSSARQGFAVLAYVFMPNHLHLLVQGTTPRSDFRSLMRNLRKRTSVVYGDLTGKILWQDGYFERVLRNEEQTIAVINYLLANPVRAGLVEKAVDYPFGWSIAADG